MQTAPVRFTGQLCTTELHPAFASQHYPGKNQMSKPEYSPPACSSMYTRYKRFRCGNRNRSTCFELPWHLHRLRN